MDNTKENKDLKYLNDFLITIGFDQKSINADFSRLIKIVLVHVMKKLEPIIPSDKPLPKIESIEDFYKYYSLFIDKATIDKIFREEMQKTILGYLKAVIKHIS